VSDLFGLTNVPGSVSNVASISAGHDFNVALKSDGTAVAWGRSSLGYTNVPSGLTNAIAISSSAFTAVLVGNCPALLHAPLSNPTISNNGFAVSVPSQSGHVYRLEYKNLITDASWIPLPLVAGIGANLMLTDPNPGSSQRFYRVRRW
jgi:hypothetical protein